MDRPGALDHALRDSRRLCGAILETHRELDDDGLLIFLSGAKGFHIGMPAAWRPEPSTVFHAVAKLFCMELAGRVGVVVDGAIYSKTRLFRAPNSRHPKTGLYKRRLSLEELTHLTPAAIVRMAAEPEPFDILTGPFPFASAADAWQACSSSAEQRAGRRTAAGQPSKLQALTREFIREWTAEGERETRLFRAAANLGEFDCPPDLAHALLTEPALDSGLTPSETRRAIDCGLAHSRRQREGGGT